MASRLKNPKFPVAAISSCSRTVIAKANSRILRGPKNSNGTKPSMKKTPMTENAWNQFGARLAYQLVQAGIGWV